ncbi:MULTISPECIES: site-specific integrase [Pseudomonas]|uniref:site-specific integrase n=1 Tax=unclassified Pseudomonas TaxID=196821 RepID=UPI00261C7EA3|nr:site-specific integrase [Pseudomonas sp. 2,4-D]MDN4513610.1 site-specific integrase [Pseudomonas sp. 2,4-D]
MTYSVFEHSLPIATQDNPLAEVHAIFDASIARYTVPATKSTYKGAKSLVINFLASDVRFAGKVIRVGQEIDQYFLVHLKNHMDFQPYSSSYRATVLSAVRGVLSYAVVNSFYDYRSFLDVVLDPTFRETSTRNSFSESEFQSFDRALDEEITFVESKLMSGYIPTGCGRPPDFVGTRFAPGWSDDENNLKWWFENKLDCEPFVYSKTMSHAQKKFYMAAKKHGGTRVLFLRWGVIMGLDAYVIMPFLFKLVTWTGLNATPAQSLKTTDYIKSHPLTGKPCIYYWKGRGQGDTDLHEGLLTGNLDKVSAEKQDVMPLEVKQSSKIEEIWNRVLDITGSIRPEVVDGEEDYLFIYMPTHGPASGQVRNLLQPNRYMFEWCRYMVDKYDLRDDHGEALEINISRLRPSLVSRLLGAGVDISVIQAILGHSDVVTTMRYIAAHNFAPKARRELHKCLSNIRKNREEQIRHPKEIAMKKTNNPAIIFSTATALCLDVYNPPARIKKATGWVEGQACTNFNMCLRCSKVVILEEHLPRLFAMQRGYKFALENGAGATTHRAVLIQNLSVLDGILGENSDFSEEVLCMANQQSKNLEVYTDPFLVRGKHERG